MQTDDDVVRAAEAAVTDWRPRKGQGTPPRSVLVRPDPARPGSVSHSAVYTPFVLVTVSWRTVTGVSTVASNTGRHCIGRPAGS